jgi:hypothetical protein
MGGNGSGRHRKSLEEKRLAVIEKAWDIVGEFLNGEKYDLNYKLQYAIDVVKKSIPQGPIIDQSKHSHFTFKYERLNGDNIRATRSANGSLGIEGEVESFSGRPEIRENAISGSRVDEKGVVPAKS